MQPLEKALRSKLERTVKEARDIAEDAARVALEQLGVGKPYGYLSEKERELRRKLRVHGRQLGDYRNPKTEVQEIVRLTEEVAYEHWHRMLFAHFLAENNLLMYPDPVDPVPVTLEECQDLAADEGANNGWELAARFATRMLPQIFRTDSPVFQLVLPPENQHNLERLLDELPVEVFTASDSLGWVYQFWQAKKKDEINASEVKIGARELPVVTQLFTEHYMVSFLLDNSLGAWWAARRLTEEDLKNIQSEEELRQKASLPGMPLEFLRFVKVEAASRRLNETRLNDIGYFHKDETIANISGNLPHWRQEGVTYFVTFRTADSLPQEKLKQWQTEKDQWLREHPEPHDGKTKRDFYEKFSERLQHWFDQGYGDCLFKEPQFKKIIEDALRYFDGERYNLDEFVVMPNHVHVLVTPKNDYELSEILHSWKSFTSHALLKVEAASRRLKETASRSEWNTPRLWQKESFDHIVRNPNQLEKIRQYICQHLAYEEERRDAASTWMPAAGTFDGWPEKLSELKTLDPCCGSGHFLVAAFLMQVPMRMELEGLSARDAVDAVLRDNLHGLEIDQRCVELAAFALALTAWRYPNAGGYRKLPELHLACSGLSVSVAKDEWVEAASRRLKETTKRRDAASTDKHNLRLALDWMYDEFKDAPVLGSLLNPAKSPSTKLVEWSELSQILKQALSQEQTDEEHEIGVVAHGLAKAAQMLAGKYHWIITNVPYLTRGKQGEILRDFCAKHYYSAKNDIATVFLDRCLEFCFEGGNVSAVFPQNWLFLTSYKRFREKLLKNDSWNLIARLGPQAFQTPMWEFNVQLLSISRGQASRNTLFSWQEENTQHLISGLDVSAPQTVEGKSEQLQYTEIRRVKQKKQLNNPDMRVVIDENESSDLLARYAHGVHGFGSKDSPRYFRQCWELISPNNDWNLMLTTVENTKLYGGREQLVFWQNGRGLLYELGKKGLAIPAGEMAWGKRGVAVSQMNILPSTLHSGEIFDKNVAVVLPQKESLLPAIWCFCSSPKYNEAVRCIDQKLNVTNATLVKVPFDLEYWQKVAEEKYPNGLPKPYSDDPTQWIFHGHPAQSDQTLQVAMARLLGYRWPAELDEGMELSDEARKWVKKCEVLLSYSDEDGIVCIPPVRGEATADDRLLNLLVAAYGDSWSTDKLSNLLKQADHAGKKLETWLRDKFFAQHCKLFHHRPFIWHIWDGLRDGFAALVNYHKLDRKNLETLIYTYLGDWINRQNDDIRNGVDGAIEKLFAADNLKKRLELILEGEAPYDIFVRWKPIEKQPIGWNPDLNDGVRLNIRPFMTVQDVGKKGAGVLRDKPNIKWNKKDRGKDVASAPWYNLGPQYGGKKGDRINDHNLTLADKIKAREDRK